MVDPARGRALLDRLGEELDHLRRLAVHSDDEILADDDRLAAIKYRFIVAIETCIDLGQHVIASESLRAPHDFADVFVSLNEGGFLDAEVVPALQQAARFRNLLVHQYMKVDDRRVVEILRTRLDDLDAFRVSLARALAEGS
jgi:uncharacterized protein YutE (UPF0331/DUF86 family)